MKKAEFVLLVIILVFLAQVLLFYRGIYLPPRVNEPDFLSIEVNYSLPAEISDSFTKGSGKVLIDMSHGNNFNAEELNFLASRIIARGYSVEYARNTSNLKNNLSTATSFVVISPSSPFPASDINAVKDFINSGGRMLLLSDPTRKSEINSLASEFGILFWNDYLYNLKENDGNFKYIYLSEFAESDITKGLKKIVFYTSSSVYGKGIIFTDSNTYSSSRGLKGRYSAAAISEDSKVLAIGDVTFLSEPYNVLDNNRLIYNIADFLTTQVARAVPAEANVSNATAVNATT